jgi:hypothetical protein
MNTIADAHGLIHLHRLRDAAVSARTARDPAKVVPVARRAGAEVRSILRLEGLAALVAGIAAYAALGGSWWLFALLFLLPDLGMIGYLRGPKAGAFTYNLTHTHAGPMVLAALAWAAAPSLLPVAAIWFAHIGFDRALGYGLKLETFGRTHLGRIGRPARL